MYRVINVVKGDVLNDADTCVDAFVAIVDSFVQSRLDECVVGGRKWWCICVLWSFGNDDCSFQCDSRSCSSSKDFPSDALVADVASTG